MKVVSAIINECEAVTNEKMRLKNEIKKAQVVPRQRKCDNKVLQKK